MFMVLAFGGILYTSLKNWKFDKQHIELVAYSKSIDREVSNSRIVFTDHTLFIDTLKKTTVLKSLSNTKNYIVSLENLLEKETNSPEKELLKNALVEVKKQIEHLSETIFPGSQKNDGSPNSTISKAYSRFQNAYLAFDKNFHDFIINEKTSFKKEIFMLIMLIFSILTFCLVQLFRLISAFHKVEKQQANKTVEVEFKERKRIAADLHDGLGSILSSIVLFVKIMEKDGVKEEIRGNLEQVKQLSNMALDNLEAVINNLNPSILNRYGLIKSLEVLCDKINDTGKINCKINTLGFDAKLSKNMEINFYRICNELINNTLKHSGASELKISFKNIKRKVSFYYQDNGTGFNPDLISSNEEEKMGLRNIISRVESFGGTYTINSEAGKGVEITIHLNL